MYSIPARHATNDYPSSRSHPAGSLVRRIVVVIDTRHDSRVSPRVAELARLHGACVVLYDLSTGSRWSTPYESDDGDGAVEPRILTSVQLQSLCHHGTAQAVLDLNQAGIAAAAYLAAHPAAEDLCDLVRACRVDLVIVQERLHGKTLRNVERVRTYGTTLTQ